VEVAGRSVPRGSPRLFVMDGAATLQTPSEPGAGVAGAMAANFRNTAVGPCGLKTATERDLHQLADASETQFGGRCVGSRQAPIQN